MAINTDKLAVSGASLGIAFALFLGLINTFAFAYAAGTFDGGLAWVYTFLAVLTGIGVLATLVAKVVADVTLHLLSKEEKSKRNKL